MAAHKKLIHIIISEKCEYGAGKNNLNFYTYLFGLVYIGNSSIQKKTLEKLNPLLFLKP